MRIVFAGTPEVAVPSLQRLLESADHEVVGVISRPDAVAGRGRKVSRSPIAELADVNGIEVITPRRMSDAEVADALARWQPDVGAVVAYGGLIPPDVLEIPPHGWINLHFSVLPAWRGAAPVQAAIAAGDETTGASTFLLEKGLDTGPVYGVLTETIRPTDTSGELLERLSDAGSTLLQSTLDGIAAGALSPVPQPAEGVSHAPKVEVDDARVRWDLPAHLLDRRIRAHTPAPGAWTTLGDARVKLGPVGLVGSDDPSAPKDLAPGRVVVTKKVVFVGTATDPVRLGWVQPPGKKQMPATDWARGARLDDETVLS
ncbi:MULTISPECIES: methionyl-tRNA formyltransferase [Gordonia]|uniref:Methionyl-tRNA formyltransferase n=1 Tax=Gordonia sputi NBRC 100414 TaxID=1089453 RepID=H5TW54_9ACTN|nr:MULTISPECIES: methionyl-tRNA formyltransferase [Gordonia]NKY93418.1 methionyl-tRNA formyltransferase [Gordonia sputi]OBA39962.1 methionyl-tRNA formyltransferase [Gordonia sp. 852002-51296_SCH5728562-b]OBC03638.1 methionyl-tRNA formyltransferase [Gordonia sp. 852002-50816_SCH5313054-a]OBC09616.1 methionyl-tRNA formyltransferase [Gordonia sp. 852002-50395_SCH5434458]OBC19020.1 methionyl-tRNA formyltransferase [Gordonia sp. 852002-50816_SCH5313054-c]